MQDQYIILHPSGQRFNPEPGAPSDPQTGVVSVDRLNVRPGPGIIQLQQDDTVVLRPDTVVRDGYIWMEIYEPARYRGAWIAVATADGGINLVDFDTAPPPPASELSALTGNITVVKRSNENGTFYVLQNGDMPWSAWPKLGVNVRSAIVSQVQGLRQFTWVDPDDPQNTVDLSLNPAEFSKWLSAYNNTSNTGSNYSINAGYLRAYVPHEQMFEDGRQDELVQRIIEFLDACQKRHMQAILVWNDSLRTEVTHTYPEERDYHQLSEHGHLTHGYWVQQGYRRAMIPFMRGVLPIIADHPGLAMHQLWNEPHPGGRSKDVVRAFKSAVHEVSSVIREHDTKHPIAIGMQHGGHAAWDGATWRAAAEYIYGVEDGFLEHIHLHSAHMYPHADATDNHAAWEAEEHIAWEFFELAPRWGRVAILDEGMTWNNPHINIDPVVQLESLWKRFYERGLYLFVLWGGWWGDSDRRLGGTERAYDNIHNKSYYPLRELAQRWGHYKLSQVQ